MNKKDQKAKIIDLFRNEIGSKANQYKVLSIDEPTQISILKNSETNFDNFLVNASDYGVPQNRKRFIIVGIREDLLENIDYQTIFESSISKHRKTEKTTVKDAIKDLPELKSNSGDNYFYNQNINYDKSSEFSKKLINHSSDGVFNHFARPHMSEDLDRYKYFSILH